jgi:hypothetical protein
MLVSAANENECNDNDGNLILNDFQFAPNHHENNGTNNFFPGFVLSRRGFMTGFYAVLVSTADKITFRCTPRQES